MHGQTIFCITEETCDFEGTGYWECHRDMEFCGLPSREGWDQTCQNPRVSSTSNGLHQQKLCIQVNQQGFPLNTSLIC